MQNVIDLPQSLVRISGEIVATDVSYDEFMAGYDGMHVEWVDGVVIKMPSIDERHDALLRFLNYLFGAYLELTGGGRILQDPMLMKLENVPSSRAPDIQILLPDRLHQLKRNQVIGPANLVVEIVSPGSRRTDRVDKLREYELGGVPEYWLLDHQKQVALFYQRSEDGTFDLVDPDEQGVYHSRALPKLRLSVGLLWRETLPSLTEALRLSKTCWQTHNRADRLLR